MVLIPIDKHLNRDKTISHDLQKRTDPEKNWPIVLIRVTRVLRKR
jgi:hypothetical protein